MKMNGYGIAGYWKCPECGQFQLATRPLICCNCNYHYEPEDFYQQELDLDAGEEADGTQ